MSVAQPAKGYFHEAGQLQVKLGVKDAIRFGSGQSSQNEQNCSGVWIKRSLML
jgi:hypothetical protein